MRQNHTLAQIRQGKPTVGLWLHSHNAHIARMIAAQGLFDWLLVDMEHSPTDLSTASLMLAGIADISAGACTPLARVPQATMFHIKQVLDAGAHGIVVPMINTAEEAAQVVRFARYPPQGDRGVGGVIPQYSFGITDQAEYVRSANNEILVSVQIETQEAVENIDAILDTPGLDMVFIGPSDLHMSLGVPYAMWSDHPTFLAAVRKVLDACRKHAMPCGIMTPNAEGAKARIADGFTFVSLSSDLRHLMAVLNAQMAQLKQS